jgi:hypothetical protein
MKPDWKPVSEPPRMIGRYLIARRNSNSTEFVAHYPPSGMIGRYLITRRHRNCAEFGAYCPQLAKWVDCYGEEINDVIGWAHAPEPMREDQP